MVRGCEEIKKGGNRAQTPVIPAKAGTHVSVTRDFSSTRNGLPTITGMFCGAMGPGLRRGDEWMSGERFFHIFLRREDEDVPQRIVHLRKIDSQIPLARARWGPVSRVLACEIDQPDNGQLS